ncbi:MAG: DUF1670 domain-containing protein [Nitrospirae bacterium]|nr:DUF1670 domain-containing protein [Nitrospirota bacterium]
MDFGKVEYIFFETKNGNGNAMRKLKLTLIGQADDTALRAGGLANLRRERILRLTKEAEEQGCLLSYEDIAGLLLTSLATLKRDVSWLERHGYRISLRGRKKNGMQAEEVHKQ